MRFIEMNCRVVGRPHWCTTHQKCVLISKPLFLWLYFRDEIDTLPQVLAKRRYATLDFEPDRTSRLQSYEYPRRHGMPVKNRDSQ